jgi:hypothetical protein
MLTGDWTERVRTDATDHSHWIPKARDGYCLVRALPTWIDMEVVSKDGFSGQRNALCHRYEIGIDAPDDNYGLWSRQWFLPF